MSDTTAVSVKNVSKQFDNVEVLRDINLTVEKGTVVSILGSSGSGKSTLLRCMNWLEQPDRGEISPASPKRMHRYRVCWQL